jgi:hypothetical protein
MHTETGRASFGVSAKTAAKWVRRYRELGAAGLRDHSSRPGRMPRQTCFSFVEKVLLLRIQRWTGCRDCCDRGTEPGYHQSHPVPEPAQPHARSGAAPAGSAL